MRRWGARSATTLAVLTLIGISAGCGGDGDGEAAPSKDGTPAPSASSKPPDTPPLTKAQAQRALLDAADLPPGWAVSDEDLAGKPEKADNFSGMQVDANCRAFIDRYNKAIGPSAVTVERELEHSGSDRKVGISLSSYRGDGAMQHMAMIRDLTKQCPAGGRIGGYKVKYGSLNIPPQGDDSAGMRMTMTDSSGSARFDGAQIRVGSSLLDITFFGDAADDPTLVSTITGKAAAKVRQAG